MKLIVIAEWLRFCRFQVNVYIVAACALILAASATLSGLEASAIRQAQVDATESWRLNYAKQSDKILSEKDPEKSVVPTYNLARQISPPLQFTGLSGLSLVTSTYQKLSTDIRIGIESRYTEGRKSGDTENPLFKSLGTLDFSLVTVIILPLMMIGLAYGLVHEDREQGRWRLSSSLTGSPWKIVLTALFLRLSVTLVVVAATSALAFFLDNGSTFSAYAIWIASCSAFGLFWMSICAASTLVRSSSGAIALSLIGIWIATTFVVPAVIDSKINANTPTPSRLNFIAQMRNIQQDTEEHNDELLKHWYLNRGLTIQSERTHAWPVSFIPRYLEQDAQLSPLASVFPETRNQQWEHTHLWTLLTPTLSIVSIADQLAGVDAKRYSSYLTAVRGFEANWKSYFVPIIMTYRAVTEEGMREVSATELVLPEQNSIFTEIVKPLVLAFLFIALWLSGRFSLSK